MIMIPCSYGAFGSPVGGRLEVPYAYTFTLRDKGDCGFMLPSTQILPTAIEAIEDAAAELNTTKL